MDSLELQGVERRQMRTKSKPARRRNGVTQGEGVGVGKRRPAKMGMGWGGTQMWVFFKNSLTEKNPESALHCNLTDFDSKKKIRNYKNSAAGSKNMKKPLKDLQAAAAAVLFTGGRVHVTATSVRPNVHAHVNSDLSGLKTETLNLTSVHTYT